MQTFVASITKMCFTLLLRDVEYRIGYPIVSSLLLGLCGVQVGYTQLRLQYEEEVGVLRAKLRDLESSARTNPSQHQLVETLQLEVRSLRHECSQVCLARVLLCLCQLAVVYCLRAVAW